MLELPLYNYYVTPTANIAVQADVYMNAIKVTDDDKDNISFNNSSVHDRIWFI